MRFECRLVCLKMFRAMSKEVKAALNLLCLRAGGPCQRSCAPTASPASSSLREIGPGHGYSTNKTLRFSNMLLGHNVSVTAVPILATDDYIFPGHTELHDDPSRWRFHVVVSSSLPLGACCLLWYTQQANDSRSVSPVALCLGLRDVDGNPIRGNMYAAVVDSSGQVSRVPTQHVFSGVLQPVAHVPGLVVHVPDLLHTVKLRGRVAAL